MKNRAILDELYRVWDLQDELNKLEAFLLDQWHSEIEKLKVGNNRPNYEQERRQ